LSQLVESIKRRVSFKLLACLAVAFVVAGIAGWEHITAVKRSSDKPGWRAACCKNSKIHRERSIEAKRINITEDDYVSVPLDTKLKSKKAT